MSVAIPDAPPQPPIPSAAAAPSDIKPPIDLSGSEAFGALDQIATDAEPTTTTPPKPATDPDKGRPKGPDGKFIKQQPKPAAKPDAPADKPGDKPPDKPADLDFDNPPDKAGDLRKHYDALKVRLKERETKLTELEKASTTPKEWPEKKTYEEKLTAHEKRLQEYEQELQFTNFVKSQAYKDTYQKPYVEAWVSGQDRAALLKVVERKDEDGTLLQQARQGTKQDFDNIMSIHDDDLAAEKAAELFGPNKSSLILYHRAQVQERIQKSDAAIKEFQEKGVTWEKQRRESYEKQTKEAQGMINDFMTKAVERYPNLFKPDDSDPKGNELLDKGKHLLERVLQGGVPLAEGEVPMTNEELAIAVAAVRNKAIGFDRVAHRNGQLTKRVKELEAKLKEYEDSQPGEGEGASRIAAGADDDDPYKKLEKLAH